MISFTSGGKFKDDICNEFCIWLYTTFKKVPSQNSFLIFIPYSFLCENFYQYISFQIYVYFNSGNSFLTQYFTAENMMKKSCLNHEINSIFNAKTLNILNLAHMNQLLSISGIGINVMVRLMNFSSCK